MCSSNIFMSTTIIFQLFTQQNEVAAATRKLGKILKIQTTTHSSGHKQS